MSKDEVNAEKQKIADEQNRIVERYAEAQQKEQEGIERGEIVESVLPSSEVAEFLYRLPETKSGNGAVSSQWANGYYLFDNQLYYCFADRWVVYTQDFGWSYRPQIDAKLASDAEKYSIRSAGTSLNEALGRFGAESMSSAESFAKKYHQH